MQSSGISISAHPKWAKWAHEVAAASRQSLSDLLEALLVKHACENCIVKWHEHWIPNRKKGESPNDIEQRLEREQELSYVTRQYENSRDQEKWLRNTIPQKWYDVLQESGMFKEAEEK